LLVVVRFVSQPFEAEPSQLAQPVLQEATAQLPLLHTPEPLAMLQTVPQLPQLLRSLFRFFSQPLAYCPSQLAKPRLHEPTLQILLLQAAVPFATLHTVPQAPQLLALVAVLTSQPSLLLPLQSAYGSVHELMPHTPPTQFGVAPPGAGHFVPHVLQ
jgi:hypothetical protein